MVGIINVYQIYACLKGTVNNITGKSCIDYFFKATADYFDPTDFKPCFYNL